MYVFDLNIWRASGRARRLERERRIEKEDERRRGGKTKREGKGEELLPLTRRERGMGGDRDGERWMGWEEGGVKCNCLCFQNS